MIINQFDTNNETNEKKENMTRKSIIPKDEYQSYKNDFDKEILNKKENTINLNDFGKWENQLPLYLDLYSKLTDEGKKEMKMQVSTLGKLVDIIQKAKNDKGVK